MFGSVLEADRLFEGAERRWRGKIFTDPPAPVGTVKEYGSAIGRAAADAKQLKRRPEGDAYAHLLCGRIITDIRVYTRGLYEDVPKLGSGIDYDTFIRQVKTKGEGLAQQNKEEAEQLRRKISQAYHTAKVCQDEEKKQWRVPFRPARPITAAQVDRYLDTLALRLETAAEADNPAGLHPIKKRHARFLDRYRPGIPRNWYQAGESARSVYVEVRSQQEQANRNLVPITPAQANRLKAFIHWAIWIMKRAQGNVIVKDEPPKLFTLVHDIPFDRLEPFAEPPSWPLFGPIEQNVPPPKLPFIEDESEINQEEYTKAFLLSAGQAADQFFTYGIASTLALLVTEYREGDLTVWNGSKAVLLVGLCNAKRVGPIIVALLAAKDELVYVYTHGWKTLSWDDFKKHWEHHAGNFSAFFLAGYHIAKGGKGPAHDDTRVRETPAPPEPCAATFPCALKDRRRLHPVKPATGLTWK